MGRSGGTDRATFQAHPRISSLVRGENVCLSCHPGLSTMSVRTEDVRILPYPRQNAFFSPAMTLPVRRVPFPRLAWGLAADCLPPTA